MRRFVEGEKKLRLDLPKGPEPQGFGPFTFMEEANEIRIDTGAVQP